MIDQGRLARICGILNRRGVVYVVAGGYACALNGHVRMTEDIDILLRDETENLEKTVLCIREMFPSITEEITIADIRDNVVLKIAQDIEVDFSIQAWTLDYSGAQPDIQHREIDGVVIPFLGLDSLIKSKDTPREIDQWDIRVLREIQKRGR